MIPATISTTTLGSFTHLTRATRMGAATAIALISSSPLKLTLLIDRTPSGARTQFAGLFLLPHAALETVSRETGRRLPGRGPPAGARDVIAASRPALPCC